tara:strand:- start:410 stop:538 length:129 start_codon:yes stop_codon:yes gene_type:complete
MLSKLKKEITKVQKEYAGLRDDTSAMFCLQLLKQIEDFEKVE